MQIGPAAVANTITVSFPIVPIVVVVVHLKIVASTTYITAVVHRSSKIREELKISRLRCRLDGIYAIKSS